MFARSVLRSATAATRSALPSTATRTTTAGGRRALATEAAKSGSSKLVPITVALLAAGAGGYYYTTQHSWSEIKEELKDKQHAIADAVHSLPKPKEPLDYHKVAAAIADVLESNPDYDDGSYGPLFVRLAWHASGTYSKHDRSGGSNGATMRYHPESSDGANNGLNLARDLLEPIKRRFPDISYADLWTLAGVVAIKEMGGPSIPWRSGRSDAPSAESCPPVGRLPDASKERKHIREVFNRMGFDDREIVALMGAHALGRCHTDRSGYKGPWTFSPTMLTNDYFKLLLSESWVKKQWDGPLQYEDKKTRSLMMLPTDMEMYNDRYFYKYTKEFAKDEAAFFAAFSDAFKKLLELGVQFPESSQTIIL